MYRSNNCLGGGKKVWYRCYEGGTAKVKVKRENLLRFQGEIGDYRSARTMRGRYGTHSLVVFEGKRLNSETYRDLVLNLIKPFLS